jgi:hypothetical protein
MPNKKIWTSFQRIIDFFLPKKLLLSSQKYVFEIRDPEKTSSGSRGHKGPGSPIRIATFTLTQAIKTLVCFGLVDLLIDSLFGSFVDRLMDWLMVYWLKPAERGRSGPKKRTLVDRFICWLIAWQEPAGGGRGGPCKRILIDGSLIDCLAGSCWRYEEWTREENPVW